jgi:hypothetical protein
LYIHLRGKRRGREKGQEGKMRLKGKAESEHFLVHPHEGRGERNEEGEGRGTKSPASVSTLNHFTNGASFAEFIQSCRDS